LPGPVTCFAGVSCLLPGRYLKVFHGSSVEDQSPARVEERTYWQIDFPDRDEEQWRSFRRWESNANSPLVDAYEAVVKRAVERRLRADVPVVSYLSGGVDSSVVVALACAQRRLGHKQPIPTYTISVQEPSLDERAEATRVAQHLGTSQVVIDFRRQ